MSPIDLENLDVMQLPSLKLSDYKKFPKIPAIYFVIDSYDVVRYVGQTLSLKKRWCELSRPVIDIPNALVAWLVVEDASDRRIYERRLIRRFQPTFNQQGVSRNTPFRSVSVKIPNELYDAIDLLSDANGHTVIQEIPFLLQEAVAARQEA